MRRGAHDVREEVVLPTDGLHEEDAGEGVDRGFFKHFVIVRSVCRLFGREVVVGACARHVVFVAFDRDGGSVVGMVGRFPCVEGTEDELDVQKLLVRTEKRRRGRTDGVKTETDEVVHPVVVGERTVSSLMCHAPPTSEDDTLTVPVERPQRPFRYRSERRGQAVVDDEGRYEWVDAPTELVDDESAGDIARDIKESLCGVSVVQVLGNDRVDLSQCHLESMLVSTQLRDCAVDLCGFEWRLKTFFVFWSIVEPGGHGLESWRSICGLHFVVIPSTLTTATFGETSG
jgi:hypothetical protein